MKIETFVLGQLQTNCYLIYDEKSKQGVIIDPADSAEFIAEKIQLLKISPKAIIATHGHFDHVLAAGELQLILNIPFYIHENDLFLLKKMNQSASYWLNQNIKKTLPLKIKFIKENDKIFFGNHYLKVLETPGHTPGSICLLINSLTRELVNSLMLFSGDTLFKDGFGRYDFSYSSKEKIILSLIKLLKLPKATIVYPGHGERTSINNEEKLLKIYNISP